MVASRFFVNKDFDDVLLEELPEFYDLIEKEAQRKDGLIEVVVSSFGGYSHVLMAYLDAFQAAKREGVIISTHVSGMAASCGSLLAVSGTKGYRTMSSYSQHYVHLGSAGFMVRSEDEAERMIGSVQSHFEFVKSIYSVNAKIPGLASKLKTDHLFVNAQTALDWKMVDKVVN